MTYGVDPEYTDSNNFCAACNWIFDNPTLPIPSFLYPRNTDKFGLDDSSLLICFIRHSKLEYIPHEMLRYIGHQNADGITALMTWVEYRPNEPIPKELLDELCIQDYDGNTALINCIRKKLPVPTELYAESGITTDYGFSALMMWCIHRPDEPIPHYLGDEVTLKTLGGETALSLWEDLHIDREIPNLLFHFSII